MKWYEGDITQAVIKSKTTGSIFVAFIEGNDETTADLTMALNDAEVSRYLESAIFIAIKFAGDSLVYRQFSQIYKSPPIPSIYFIGKSGRTLDIIKESLSAEELVNRVLNVLEMHVGKSSPNASISQETIFKSTKDSMNSTASQEKVKEADLLSNHGASSSSFTTDSLSQDDNNATFLAEERNATILNKKETADQKDAMFLNEEKKLEMENVTTDNEAESYQSDDSSNLSGEEKMQRVKELIEKKREAKKQEEEEIERAKEIERRKMGQEVQKLRRWQQDQELKNLMEERQRAKNEEKAARDRILAQIAQDKADRAAKFGTSPPTSKTTIETSTNNATKRAGFTTNTNIARLQFRLPDGSSQTHDFDSTCTLQEVRNYISLNLNLPFRNFSLSTTFPRREFTVDDNEENLRDLELCPNAVILILPVTNTGAVAATNGGFMSLIWLILSPVIGFFGMLRNMIFGGPQTSNQTTPDKNKRTTDTIDPQAVPPSKRKATESAIIRRQGNSNIHRLSDRTDSDDDNNTWNGNSTQQM